MTLKRFTAPLLRTLAILLIMSGMVHGVDGVRIVNGDFGAATVSGSNYVVAQETGGLLRSADGGLSFSVALLSPVVIYGLGSEGSTVIGVGQNGQIFRSTDGGASFVAMISAEAVIFGDLVAVVSNGNGRWVAVGSDTGEAVVYVSNDDGATWTTINSLPGDAVDLRGVAWLEGVGQFLAVGETAFLGGVALVSSDGSSWSEATLPEDTPSLYFAAADSAGNTLAGGRFGTLLRSSASPLNFSAVGALEISESLTTARAVEPDTWWVGGEEGLIFTVAPGGAAPSWVIEPDPSTNPVVSLTRVGEVVLAAGRFSSYPWEALQIEFTPLGGGQYRLRLLNPRPFHQYRVERSPNLQTWTTVEGSDQVAGEGPLEWTVTPPVTGVPRFYRVRLN